MKALRYLLIVAMLSTAGVLSVVYATAQNLAQHPKAEMRSTSIMPSSGSSLPQAAVDGAHTTGDAPESYTPTSQPEGPRRSTKGWGSGGEEGEPGSDRPEPYATPLGDVMWPLMLLAFAYLIVRVTRRRRRA